MSDITLRQVEYYLAVVDHGSISEAARGLHISQAAVSVAVQQLERSLNAELLSRSPARRARPTPAGQALLPHARRVLASISEAAEAVRDDHSEMRGVLRIVTSINVSPHVLPPLLAYFTEHFPEVKIEISEASTRSIHEALRSGDADLGVCYERQSSPEFKTTLVEDVRQHVMLPSTHALAGRDDVYLRELIAEPFIMVDIPPSVERITQLILNLGLTPNLRWTSKNFETVRSLVAHGLGWSFVNVRPTSTTTYDELEVSYVPIADDIPPNPIVAITRPDGGTSARERETIDFLKRRRARPRP